MYKVTVKNEKNNLEWGASFDDEITAQQWIDSHIERNTWGKPQREVLKKIEDPAGSGQYFYLEETYIEEDVIGEIEREVKIIPDENGIDTELRTYVILKAEYDYTITSVFDEYRALKLKELSTICDNFLYGYSGRILIDRIGESLNGEWNSGEQYRKNIEKTLAEANKGNAIVTFPVVWLDYTNTIHSLNELAMLELISFIETDMYKKGQQAYQAKWVYRATIEVSSNKAEIENAISGFQNQLKQLSEQVNQF